LRQLQRRGAREGQGQAEQLALISEASPLPWWQCRGIFSPAYIQQRLEAGNDLPSSDEVRSLYEVVRTRWLTNLAALARRKEAYTRSEFLDPALADLGWHFIPDEDLPAVPTRKVPDYCLFGQSETKQRVAAGNAADIFRACHTVLEAKKVQHPLDQVSKTETPGWFPSDQIQDYLRYAKDQTGRRFFNWAILTNGDEWRLYCEHAGPSAYFSFHLARDGQFCPLEEFRLFVALFQPTAFEQDPEQRCLLDDLREEALHAQVRLEENLRKRIFDVLEELAEGFFSNPENRLKEADLGEVYQTSLIFLYRLLFVLYAESRDLLPAKRAGGGANRRYRDDFSLARLVDRLRDRNAYPDEYLDGLYDELLNLFHLINGTRPRQNASLRVTRYNGGLFDPPQRPEIDKWRVGERGLANVLRQLIFAQPPSRPRTQQQVIQTQETIDYSTLEVRQLGDIYEGLLGAHLEQRGDHLELLNERGQNQREGIFYTPDWVVLYLARAALRPLLDDIEASLNVQAGLNNGRRDDSFAEAVLCLNIVDPAMGSGHFLVRATEWLAEQIVRHGTTRRRTEQIVATGDRTRSREEILADGLIPVSPGISQEDAEIAYWRRRVVESCIYGVDSNPLAVELAKLSLWLTCIAIDEPLNFLDHHLRCGNSLLSVRPGELVQRPTKPTTEQQQLVLEISKGLTGVLREVIKENARIEGQASTELEIIKAKEDRWRKVRAKLDPFLQVANLWLSALGGVPIEPDQYRLVALSFVSPGELTPAEKRKARNVLKSLQADLAATKKNLNPFHWHVEFPEVFFQPDGVPQPETQSGFDVVLGNPPYISTHTSSEEAWRPVLERRAGYLEDLYVHFTDLGFSLLRGGGTFGFIVSDTFFTLASKLRMRELLQSNRLLALGQCDPFKATVDASIFVARKELMADKDKLLFVQARHPAERSKPEDELPTLALACDLPFMDRSPALDVGHTAMGCLRVHEAPVGIYRQALKQAFFEPRPAVLELYRRFNEPAKKLIEGWWDRISTSEKFAENLPDIRRYHVTLKPGETTLVGLVAEGGQGLATANNSRFLGHLAGTPQAEEIAAKREQWTRGWLEHGRVKAVFQKLLRENGGDPARPTANVAAWEACVEPLKAQFKPQEDLDFRRTDLYRVVPPELVATPEDFEFTWKERKAELLPLWQSEPLLAGFWEQGDLSFPGHESLRSLRNAKELSDEAFCALCQSLLAWREAENQRRKTSRSREPLIPFSALGLRQSEKYTDPADAPRIATIYNGLRGRGRWVPYRKGDPEGNRWIDNEALFIDWSSGSVHWLRNSTAARWQGEWYFFMDGISWTRGANHVGIKAKMLPPGVTDVNAMKLCPLGSSPVKILPLLALMNTDVFSFTLKKFIAHTWMAQINDLRMMPFVIPKPTQAARLTNLAEGAIEAKRLTFTGEQPPNELVVFARQLDQQLNSQAPSYLRPPAQLRLLDTPDACLGIIERAVNWEAERLYGVEGLGPFDEF
jgi:hypothetical protein